MYWIEQLERDLRNLRDAAEQGNELGVNASFDELKDSLERAERAFDAAGIAGLNNAAA